MRTHCLEFGRQRCTHVTDDDVKLQHLHHLTRVVASQWCATAYMLRLAAQLARTEEAAKRALIRTDQSAKGTTAQQLLDAQRKVQQLQAENSELSSKLAR